LAQAPPERKVALANVLGKRGDVAAVPALSEAAKAGETGARVAAIAALAEIGNAQAASILLGLLADADTAVVQAAATAVSALPGPAVDDAVLAAVAAATDAAAKGKVLEIARQRRIAKALPLYLSMMKSEDKGLRSAAIRCYAELAGEAEIGVLVEKLAAAGTPPEAGEYEKAVMVVMSGRADNVALVPPLVVALGKATAAGKPAVLRLLRATGGPAALQAVRAAVDSPDKELHTAAIRALGEWKSTDAAPLLLELAKSASAPVDKILCLRGCLGMAARPELSGPDKVAMCRVVAPLIDRDDERRLLLGALGGAADATALDLVTPLLDQAGVKNEAGATVLAIAAKRPAGQHAAVTKAALEKTVQACADQAETVKKARELLAALANEKP
jgi:HEAT repeat protein